ncbi:hypothetical protein scyTo_0011772 [Scyliorhinus torazame]|uniref:Uncharacterized protein n=1 Tax=Scyliorhinus torazame TaxID=75743 RepID=A0A401NUQ1_SCYTO|nr:hypothetical protein [Scyliorhinus torazame]
MSFPYTSVWSLPQQFWNSRPCRFAALLNIDHVQAVTREKRQMKCSQASANVALSKRAVLKNDSDFRKLWWEDD